MARPTTTTAKKAAAIAESDSDASSSEEQVMPAKKGAVRGKGKAPVNKRRVQESEDEDSEERQKTSSDEDNDDEDDDENEDSENIAVPTARSKTSTNGSKGGKPVNNGKSSKTALNGAVRAAKSSSESTGSSASSGSSVLAPVNAHLHRSPVRTVSLNDANPKRRLSNGGGAGRVFSASDALRRQSLPSSLRKTVSANSHEDADASFASSAGAASPAPGAASRARPSESGGVAGARPGKGPPMPVRRTSAGYALHGGGIGALNAALRRTGSNNAGGSGGPEAALPMPILSMEAMNTNYEEWMKMATDNKINSSNTWSFALIDYFHDMSLLRNADDEGSINFQKASCTLDGCVKIWTSRVDSVATETSKLLNGLAGDAAAAAADAQSSDDDEGGEGRDGDGEERPKKKRTRAVHATTLADSFSKIQVKELDLEFTVDPLFKKTSADFDEGGAAGLLMNHLGSDKDMRVVFDASDAREVDEEEDGEEGAMQAKARGKEREAQGSSLIDVSKLKAKFLPDLTALQDMHICPSLSAFKFSADPNALDMTIFNRANLEASTSSRPDERRTSAGFRDGSTDLPAGMDYEMAAHGAGTQDFFDDHDNDYEVGGAGGFGMEDDMHGGMGGHEGYGPASDSENEAMNDGGEGYVAAQGAHHALGAMQRFDPRLAADQREVVIGMGGEEGDRKVFSYFDAALAKNWAGPEHWKMRKTIRRVAQEEHEEGLQAGKKAKKTNQAPKEPFRIDFSADAPPVDAKKIFATSNASITLPGTKKKKASFADKKEDYLLPDDMHFSSQQLLRLFLKPKAAVNMRRRVQRVQQRPEGEVDEHYWAAAAAAQADPAGDDDDDDDDDGGALPFDTQFFHEDGEGPDYDEDMPIGGDEFEAAVDMNGLPQDGAVEAGPSGATAEGGDKKADEEDDLLAATQTQVKRARPQFVNYAKKSKRVDVKKLKENIWKELALDNLPTKSRRPAVQDEADDEDMEDDEAAAAADIKEFTSVISGLRKTYPEEKMEEISTSYCFICLLHLANEQGLRIQAEGEQGAAAKRRIADTRKRLDEEMENNIKFVGSLEKLRITKVPLL